MNLLIKHYDLNMIYVSGPGHGGPAVVANTHLEGTYSEIYPHVCQDEAGRLGWTPYFVEGHDSSGMHQAMAAALDSEIVQIREIQ